ncbi:MAG TPA: hypothetical protein VJ984_05895 [Xanthomonadales bacterium]|nr:hypothetical protein [Xanthomonadales bacterium]
MQQFANASTSDAWIRTGSLMGLTAALIYYGMAFPIIPDRLQELLALIFPGLLLCGHVALFHWFNRQRPSALNQAALIFGIGAPILFTAMICAQMSMANYMDRFFHTLDKAGQEAQINIWRAADSIQLGIDVAWDMFILPTILMFAILAFRHLPFGKLIGAAGVVLGIGGLVFNIWTFPTPPIDVGLPDVGPFAMAWYAIFFATVFLNRSSSTIENQQLKRVGAEFG